MIYMMGSIPYHALLLTYGSVNEEDKFESEGDAFEENRIFPAIFMQGRYLEKVVPRLNCLAQPCLTEIKWLEN